MAVELTHPAIGPLSIPDDTSELPRRLQSFAHDTESPLDYLQRVGNHICARGIPTSTVSGQFYFYTEQLETGLESFDFKLSTSGLQHGPFWEINEVDVYWNAAWRSTKNTDLDIPSDYLKIQSCFNVPSHDFQLPRLSHSVRSGMQEQTSKAPLKLLHPMLGLHDELLECVFQSTQTSENLSFDLTQTAFRLAEESQLYSGLSKVKLVVSLPRYSSHESRHRIKALSTTILPRTAWQNMKQRSHMTEPHAGKHTVFIALGSNLGDRLHHLEAACGLMAKGESGL